MQALDFLMRRLRLDKGRGLRAFQRRVTGEIQALYQVDDPSVVEALRSLADFTSVSQRMAELEANREQAHFEANDYLRAAWQAVVAWMAVRLERFNQRRLDQRSG
ncbi:hypothetical protein ABID21_003019 [Pseudorhizobium tarimense]|uniref:Uncharacterized protein n=1 Tax=Pseudorhizobium tarimense TaxID=1079109 RepID=A0ABV2H9M0_9HYPH|nr:hypothetical protein [Pseudorhizobium tarimense]MCJ8520023.1 hypothetical protein [Pseudorhizobium tarimense]